MQWRVLIALNGIDKSSQLIGEVMIDAEEDSAAIAEFTLLPEVGPINADQWIGAPVVIESIVDGGAPERLFTGTVDVPKYDIKSGLTKFRCSDGLQKRFEEMTRSQIDDIVAAYWSPYVFDDAADGWSYALDQMSTDYYSVDADRFGNIGYYSLKGDQYPVFTYDDSSYISGSLDLDLPSYRDLVNQIDLSVECRYTVYVEATAGVGWAWLYKPGEAPGWPVPAPSAAQSAASSVGHLKSFSYQEFPPTGLYKIGSWTPASPVDISSGSFVSWLNDRPSESCFSFSATAAKRAAVEVTWRARHQFRFDDSIARYGACKKEETFSLDLSAPPVAGWEQFSAEMQLPDGFESSGVQSDVPVSFDPALYREVLLTLSRLHMVDILKRHRAKVRFDVPFAQTMDRKKIARINSAKISATGKVFRYVHRLNTETGAAITELTLAPNICGADEFVALRGWWAAIPSILPTKPTEFDATVTFTSRDPSSSGSVGFQVDVDAPDFATVEFAFSDPDKAGGDPELDIMEGRIESVSDELVIYGRTA